MEIRSKEFKERSVFAIHDASLPLIVVLPTRSTHRPGTQGGTP